MIKNRLKDLDISQEKYSQSHFGFLRNITTISVGLFGLLVSLKPKIICLYSAKIAFMTTICSLGLGILFSVISQYYDVYVKREDKVKRTENIAKVLKGEEYKDIQFVPQPKIFKISEILTYSFLGLSIVSLIFYVFLIEFKN